MNAGHAPGWLVLVLALSVGGPGVWAQEAAPTEEGVDLLNPPSDLPDPAQHRGTSEITPLEPGPEEDPGFFPDPEVFSDPASLPGPIPPPPTVTPSYDPTAKFTEIQADKIFQDRLAEITTLEGNVVVVYEDTTIRSQSGTISDKDEVGHFWGEGGVEVENDDGILNTTDLTLRYAEDEKQLLADGAVHALIYRKEDPKPLPANPTRRDKMRRALESEDTTLNGDVLHYWWGTKEFHLWVEGDGVAEMLQEGRTAKAVDIHYLKEPEVITMTGSVELWHANGQWLYANDLIENRDSKVLRALMAVASTVTCESLVRSEETEVMVMDGDVHWVQEDKEARANTLTIDESEIPPVPVARPYPKVYELGPAGLVEIHDPIPLLPVDEEEPEEGGGSTPEAEPLIVEPSEGIGMPSLAPDESDSEDSDAVSSDNAPLHNAAAQPPEGLGGRRMIAEGDVYAHQKNGDWLFIHAVIDEDTHEKVREDARREAEGWAERFTYHLDSEDFRAEGDVRGRQPHQRARADVVDYEKEPDLATFTGDVYMYRRAKDALASDRGVLFLTSDVYEAFGNVESRAILTTDPLEPSDSEGGLEIIGFPDETNHPDRPEEEFGPSGKGAEEEAPPAEGAGEEEPSGAEGEGGAEAGGPTEGTSGERDPSLDESSGTEDEESGKEE